MVPSNVNKAQRTHDPQDAQKVVKARRHRRPKSKRREALAETPAQASTSVTAKQSNPWSWVSITEPPTTKHPPVFTKDGSYFFSVVGSCVKIYSTATGLVVSTLSSKREAGGHTNTITSAILNPHNAYQLITGSLDGHIKVWDLLDGVLLRTIGVGNPVCHIAAHERWKDFLFVAVARPSKKKRANVEGDSVAVLRVSLKPSPATLQLPVQAPSESMMVGKTRTTRGLAVSAGGSWLVAIGGHKAYFVSPEALTCLACHPTEEYFATGDDKGNIRLWSEVEQRAQTSTLHWHAHAESVLVIWQLHSGKREFVPRVGAPIDSVAVARQSGEEDYLLALADASLVFIGSAKLKITRSYSGIKLGNRPSTSAPTPLTVHSLSSTLILPSSHPSSLQTYSPSSSKLISELEVSPSNRVSRRDEKMLEPSRVERAVVSPSGIWLATIDSREGGEYFRGEVHMKFGVGTILRDCGASTHASTGHTGNQGSGLLLVTSGEDGNVKSWGIRSVANKKAGTSDVFWVARSRLTFKREIPWSISWSPDSSLLAVGFGAYTTIFDPILSLLRSSVVESIQVHFLGRDGRFLAVNGLSDVVLWDLVTQKVQWHHRCEHPVSAVVPHPRDELLAVFYSHPPSSTVSIFDPSGNSPRNTYTLPFTIRNVVWYPQLSSKAKETSTFHLVGITDNWDVIICGDDVHLPAGEDVVARGLSTGSQAPHKRTLLQDIFGDSALAGAPVVQKKAAGVVARNGNQIMDILGGPAYLTPPMETLFEPLMTHFLTPRTSADETIPEPGLPRRDEEDYSMDVDESQDNPLVSHGGTRTGRVVDAQELGVLIELFRHHGVKASSPVPHAQLSNGHVPRNTHQKVNGHAHPPKTKVNVNNVPHPSAGIPCGRSSPESLPHTTPTTPSPVITGKKRKKIVVS
ncbi:WD40 repeat-like protein [Russula earlei]|uniref:WD40 repeat-like protein n=1 Tax=Russula earlei TaxID=71964 RepID=A0ACC0ULD7_9AGAM|nr:WD40 repeat-like protein [Russula earlei]